MTNKTLWEKCFDNISQAFGNVKSKNVDTDYVNIRYYELSELRLKIGVFTPFYYIKNISEFKKSKEFFNLKGRTKPAFIIISEKKPKFKLLTPIIFLKDKALANQTGSSVVELILKESQKQCPVESLSPYETDAAVFGDQFFGRKMEIKKIITSTNTNFTIFGSRRMGKTSLLKHLEYVYTYKVFSSDLNKPNSGKAIFLSCLGVKNLSAFQELLISNLAPSDYWKDKYQTKLGKKKASTDVFYQNYFRLLSSRYNRGVILLLDEIDGMIESPQCDEIVKFQRLLSTVGYRFIQTGYRAVWREMQNIKSNFWNFSRPLPLAQFNKNDSLELIEKPMANMGITLAPSISPRIYEETGGIPNYMQHYCSVAVSKAESLHKRIDEQIFGISDGDISFDRIVMNSFHQNVREPFERLILYIVTFENLERFSIHQILASCKKWDLNFVSFDDINERLNVLKVMGFVQPVGEDLYRVIAPIIIKALRKRNIEKKLDEVVKTIKLIKND